MLKKDNRIHVLHIITNLPLGGAQDNTLMTVEKLDRTKFEVSLLCSSEGQWLERARQIENLNLIFVDELTRKIRIPYDLIAFWKIYKFIQQGQYTVVHTHSSKPGVLGRLAARLAGVPVIIHTIHGFPFHDFMNPVVRHFFIVVERLLSKLTHRLVTVSKLNLEKAVSLRLANRRKFVNIYSGIEFEKYDVKVDVEAKKNELGIVNGEKIVGMVGRFSEQKAPLNFIKAIPGVLNARSDVCFVMVGDGELRQNIVKLSSKLGLRSKIRLLGYREDIAEILQILDVYVLPSLWEGLGRSLTEAMYASRPVVATDVEGVPELVKHEETGILVPPNDVQAIARGILTLLSDEQKAQRLGKAAKQRIGEAFRADAMVRSLERVYEEVISERTKN